MTEEKRDTYLQRAEILIDIEKIKKSINRIENNIDKVDETSFDIKFKTFKKDSVDKMNVLRNKIFSKEQEINLLKKEYERLMELQIKTEVIL